MKTSFLTAAAAVAVLAGSVCTSGAQIIINEVYGGGGSTNANASYMQDFIELYNKGTNAVDLTGYTLAYGSSTSAAGNFLTNIGTLGASNISGSSLLQPLSFLLVRTGATASGGMADPLADFNFATGASLSASSGAVRLDDNNGVVLDRVGYGTTNNAEGSPATGSAINLSLQRTGFIDTDNNAADFTALTPTPMTSSVPEPVTVTYILGGLGALALFGRRRLKA